MELRSRYIPTDKQALAHRLNTRFKLFGGAMGGGKVLGDNDLALTPFGFKKGSDFKVGDLVNNPDGSVQRIIQIKPRVTLPLWRVKFRDGTFTNVAADHLWLAWRAEKTIKVGGKRVSGKGSAQVVETQTMKKWIEAGYTPQIPVCEEQPFNVTTNEKERIDPYLLGVLLGDGYLNRTSISCHDNDKAEYRKIFGEEGFSYVTKSSIRLTGNFKKHTLKKLDLYGLRGQLSDTKFIPRQYKLSSIADRYSIVQGLMDTDGHSSPEKNGCYYYTTSKKLSQDMSFVLRSLGAVVTVWEDVGSYKNELGEKIIGKKTFNLYIKHPNPDKLFRLPRKQYGFKRNISKAVSNIEIDGYITGRCITVSNPNGLYITNDFIVTHNSRWLCEEIFDQCMKYAGNRAIIARFHLSDFKNSTLKTLLTEVLPQKLPYELNKSENRVTLPNGSEIIYMGLSEESDVNKLKSMAVGCFGFDEASEIPKEQFTLACTRLRHILPDKSRPAYHGLLTSNPEDCWLKDTFVRGKGGEDYVFIPSLPSENPYLPPDYKRNFRDMPEDWFKRYWEGNWDDLSMGDTVIPKEWIEACVNLELPRENKPVIGADIGRFGADESVAYFAMGHVVIDCDIKIKEDLKATTFNIMELEKRNQPALRICIDDIGLGCLTPGTEVLTASGWKRASKVKEGEGIYTKDKDGYLTHASVISNTKREPTRVLELNNGYKFSYSHFLGYKTRANHKFKLKSWEEIVKRKQVWLDTRIKWDGKKVDFILDDHKAKMPNGGSRLYKKGFTIKGGHFCKFLGWFLSEGHVNKSEVVITQSNKSVHNEAIKKVLRDCGLKFNPKKCKGSVQYKIHNKRLSNWLMANCYGRGKKHSLNKKIPDFLKQLSAKHIRLFLNAFRDGDGYKHKGSNCYVSSSKKLAEDILELVYKTGKYGNIRVKSPAGSEGSIFGRKFIRTADNYIVYEWCGTSITIEPFISKEYYIPVYDIKVSGETKLFLVRFKDKRAFWVHNGGVTDFLAHYGAAVDGVNVGRRSEDERFFNQKAQLWWNARELFRQRKVSIPADDKLIRQLGAVKYRYRATGKIIVEPKEDTKKRLGGSPDRADALVLCLWAATGIANQATDFNRVPVINITQDSYGWDKVLQTQEEPNSEWTYYK